MFCPLWKILRLQDQNDNGVYQIASPISVEMNWIFKVVRWEGIWNWYLHESITATALLIWYLIYCLLILKSQIYFEDGTSYFPGLQSYSIYLYEKIQAISSL